MKIISSGKTDTGKTRTNNEDSFLVDEAAGLYVVADGIGGHQGGEVASRMAVETLAAALRERSVFASSSSEADNLVFEALTNGFFTANIRVRQAAAETPALSGMGTTMTALFLHGNTAYVAHVGDSRAYQLRDSTLTQVSDDHSLVAEQVRGGVLTREQARTSPYRHIITRAIGLESLLDVDRLKIELREGDTFLLCTDGLTEMAGDREIAAILADAAPPEATERLVRLANDHGGIDNVTVVVVAVEDIG